VHPGLGNLSLSPPLKYSSKIDTIYAIVLCVVLGVAAIALCFTRYQTGNPFFAKQAIKLPIFRFRPYDSLPTENGNGVDHDDVPKVTPEPLVGWRYRLGILQNAVLLALIFVHALILLTAGVQLLRIVFIAYWVYFCVSSLTSVRCITSKFTAVPENVVPTITVQHHLCFGHLSPLLSCTCRHRPTTLSKVTNTGHFCFRDTRMAIQ